MHPRRRNVWKAAAAGGCFLCLHASFAQSFNTQAEKDQALRAIDQNIAGLKRTNQATAMADGSGGQQAAGIRDLENKRAQVGNMPVRGSGGFGGGGGVSAAQEMADAMRQAADFAAKEAQRKEQAISEINRQAQNERDRYNKFLEKNNDVIAAGLAAIEQKERSRGREDRGNGASSAAAASAQAVREFADELQDAVQGLNGLSDEEVLKGSQSAAEIGAGFEANRPSLSMPPLPDNLPDPDNLPPSESSGGFLGDPPIPQGSAQALPSSIGAGIDKESGIRIDDLSFGKLRETAKSFWDTARDMYGERSLDEWGENFEKFQNTSVGKFAAGELYDYAKSKTEEEIKSHLEEIKRRAEDAVYENESSGPIFLAYNHAKAVLKGASGNLKEAWKDGAENMQRFYDKQINLEGKVNMLLSPNQDSQ